MDIGSKHGYPSASLSNFHPHPFVMDGVQCASMEGFLQSLKFKNPEMQKHVCSLVGRTAKFKGKHKAWWRDQTLWWKGEAIDRHAGSYQVLLDKAFSVLSKNVKFKKALLATRNATLTHSIGNNDSHRTVLTEREFCSRLTKLRKRLLVSETTKKQFEESK